MRFSLAVIALLSVANALPTAQSPVDERSVATGDLADLETRAEGLRLEERKKKKNATAAAAAKAAKASGGATRSLPLVGEQRRNLLDTVGSLVGDLEVRAEGLRLEERKKKKNATAAAAAKAAKASGAATRSMKLFDTRDVDADVEERGLLDTATGTVGDLVGDLNVRAEGLKLEERKKKNATAAAAAKAAKASGAASRSVELLDERDIEARAEGLRLEERKKKKNATAAAAATNAAANQNTRSVDLNEVARREVDGTEQQAERRALLDSVNGLLDDLDV